VRLGLREAGRAGERGLAAANDGAAISLRPPQVATAASHSGAGKVKREEGRVKIELGFGGVAPIGGFVSPRRPDSRPM